MVTNTEAKDRKREFFEKEDATEIGRENADALSAINDLAVELAGALSVEGIYRIACDRLRALTNARAGFVTSYEKGASELTVRCVSAGSRVLSILAGMGGRFVEGSRFPLSEKVRGEMLSLRVRLYDGLYALSQKTIPKPIAAALEKALGSGAIYAIALRYGGEVLGGIAILMPTAAPPYPFKILENFGNVVAAAVRRKQIEESLSRTRDELEARVVERTADLTAALNRLRESEETHRGLVRMLPDGVTLVDVCGKVTYASLQTARLHGFDDPEEMLGRDGFEFVAPEERERAAALLRRALDEGGVKSIEFVMARRDESRFYAEMNAVLLQDDAGRPKGFVITTKDISERKRADDELRRALAENEALLEAIPDLMFIINKEGTYVDFKRADPETLALPPDSIIGKNVRDTGFSPEAEKKIFDRIGEALRTAATTTVEYELETPRGRGVYEARFVKLNEDEVLTVVRDITERKDVEEELRLARDELERRVEERTAELERSNDDLRTFMYIVSHDMRAPLVNLRGFAGELRSSLADIRETVEAALPYLDEEKRAALSTRLRQDVPESLGFIEASVKRMGSFIDGVLKLSRLGRRELEFEALDMEALVRETMDTLRHQLERRGARFNVGPLPGVVADRTSMEQIAGNLLTNAVLYLDPARPGEILVTGGVGDGETVFQVRDNGRGIAPRDLKKIFEPFTRVDETCVPGEGMGLAYARALVGRHGGRVWCESELGVGTTFTFTVPLSLKEGGGHG